MRSAIVRLLLPGVLALISPPAHADCTHKNDLYIGVAISGGGFRASAFGYGVMQGLREARLPDGVLPTAVDRQIMDNVDTISAVSGGSIAAGYYAANKPPEEFASLLANTDVVDLLTKDVVQRAKSDFSTLSFMLPGGHTGFEKIAEWRGLAQSSHMRSHMSVFIPPDLEFKFVRTLKINTLNLSGMHTFVFPDDLECLGYNAGDFSVLTAAVASSSLPGVFEPLSLKPDSGRVAAMIRAGTYPARCRARVGEGVKEHLLADGGLVDNLGLAQIIREITARKQAGQRGLRAIVFLVNAGLQVNRVSDNMDGKDIISSSMDRLIDDRTKDTIEAVRDYLSLYGVELIEFNIDDLKKSLHPNFYADVDSWSLGKMVPESFIREFIDAARSRVALRMDEINDKFSTLCSAQVVAAPTNDDLPPPLTEKSFFEWEKNWTVEDDSIVSTVSHYAYQRNKKLIEAQRRYIANNQALADGLAATRKVVEELKRDLETNVKAAQELQLQKQQIEQALAQEHQTRAALEKERQAILDEKQRLQKEDQAKIANLDEDIKRLSDSMKASTDRLLALSKQVTDTQTTINVLREMKAAVTQPAAATTSTPPTPVLIPPATPKQPATPGGS